MSHKHEQLIRAIFREPISGNIHWREVESLLHHLGATVEPLSGARVRVRLNGIEGVLHRPHHSNVLDRQGVRNVRAYLAHSRVTPSQYEAAKPGASAP
jgi:HicA toxin of bacterial toxin-antitoxin,